MPRTGAHGEWPVPAACPPRRCSGYGAPLVSNPTARARSNCRPIRTLSTKCAMSSDRRDRRRDRGPRQRNCPRRCSSLRFQPAGHHHGRQCRFAPGRGYAQWRAAGDRSGVRRVERRWSFTRVVLGAGDRFKRRVAGSAGLFQYPSEIECSEGFPVAVAMVLTAEAQVDCACGVCLS